MLLKRRFQNKDALGVTRAKRIIITQKENEESRGGVIRPEGSQVQYSVGVILLMQRVRNESN